MLSGFTAVRKEVGELQCAKKAKFASKFVDFVALAFLTWPGGELVG